MKLGKLFKAVMKLPLVPVALVADIAMMGVEKATEGKFLVEKTVDSIADDLDEADE